MTNYIRKMSGKQYLKRLEKDPVVIIPTGACEIYGPQLPMGTDLIAAQRIASSRLPAILLSPDTCFPAVLRVFTGPLPGLVL